ncbi:MAG: hypothetical protein DRP56_01980 [Planctomycetota bacterium]|nr:MAG: hypothetical protein DRP56_01980 [Planctomycetota bacterium]
MTDQPLKISDEWVQKLLSVLEFERQDFKRVGNVSKIFKTASAMANSEGGLIILGLGDPKQEAGEDRLFGVEENPESIGEIKRGLQESVDPPLGHPETTAPSFHSTKIQKSDGSVITIVLLFVEKSNTVHSYNNATYIRSGSQNRQIGAHQTHRLCLRRGVVSVVNQPVDVPVELLDTSWWNEYSSQRNLTRPISEALKHLGLSIKDNDKWKPTTAAVLLFAEEPNGLLGKKCSIRIFHYKGHEIEYSSNTNLLREPITITGPLLKQIRGAVEAVSRELNSGIQRTDQGFELKQDYPMRVIQEAVTNAVLHRDYHVSGDIHIRIFTNRIEIESPGLFPGAITPGNIGLIGSKPRNPKLTDHIREFPKPPNLDAGEGVRMMRMTMENLGFYPPVFQEHSAQNKESVLVRISNEAKLSEWQLAEDYLCGHDSIGNKELRKILNWNASESHKASRLFKGWVESGLLRIANPQEGTRNRRYVLASKSNLFADMFESISRISSNALFDKGLQGSFLASEKAEE